jgi:5-methylcytosine-specific restriction enzyme subunit McrC
VPRMVRRPTDVQPWCGYTEHTADIEDNQILAWTLQAIGRSGLCSDRVRPVVRRAFHDLQGLVSLVPFSPTDCVNRNYNRLNDDYAPLHHLSRFFLEHIGPHHALGATPMLPFLIDMDRLFELFVAEWLKTNLPVGHRLTAQEQVTFGKRAEVEFKIDLLLFEPNSLRPWSVLDTKYKWPKSASTDDIQQVVTYAEAKACTEAFLVYPAPIGRPLDILIGRIRVRSLVFDLQGEVGTAGRSFMSELGLQAAAAAP